MKLDKKKKIIIAVVAVVVLIAVAIGAYFALAKKDDSEPEQEYTNVKVDTPISIKNPLTGEADYNKDAVGKRPVSVVVENSSAARPQYNIKTPDIIVEGEVEGGETRMLWFYSDMTALPEQVGPTRSARPSFVEFSRFFDSVYVHFGGSHSSKGEYVGGYETIDKLGVDHIDGIKSGAYFKRTKDKKSPHNAVLLGKKVVSAIEDKGFRKDVKEKNFSKLSFYDELTPVSSTACNNIEVKISKITPTHKLKYDSEKGVYTNSSDYKTPVSFANVIVMFADSKYIDKDNYKGSGKTETYLNYNFSSGKGQLASGGAIVDFNWKVENGVLKFTDVNGNDLKLNPGKSWIALASANHEGSVNFE